jgi:membrane-bound lytic murein transglycosylase A
MIRPLTGALLVGAVLLAGCASAPSPVSRERCPCGPAVTPTPPANVLEPVAFGDVPGWTDGEQASAWRALLSSCQALRARDAWRAICADAAASPPPDDATARRFLEARFVPWRLAATDGRTEGLVTGYYEPLLRGSRVRQPPFLFPLYAPPDDLLTIDLSAVNPDLRNLRLRGRVQGRRVVPYYSRAEIEAGTAPIAGKELVWVDDAVEAFFLQIQGSGRVQLENGDVVRVGYADQNGHPYQSIGRYLVERGELQPGEASMQAIHAWAASHPDRLGELLNQNPSYVFFRELPLADPAAGPVGALGVPLTPQRSIAVDARYVPLGAPVFLATTWPAGDLPLNRLVLAQDTGGAIRGPVRADYFWGSGAEAGALAGRMRQTGRIWVLLPKGMKPPAP